MHAFCNSRASVGAHCACGHAQLGLQAVDCCITEAMALGYGDVPSNLVCVQ